MKRRRRSYRQGGCGGDDHGAGFGPASRFTLR
jgi:hypothetical protein